MSKFLFLNNNLILSNIQKIVGRNYIFCHEKKLCILLYIAFEMNETGESSMFPITDVNPTHMYFRLMHCRNSEISSNFDKIILFEILV